MVVKMSLMFALAWAAYSSAELLSVPLFRHDGIDDSIVNTVRQTHLLERAAGNQASVVVPEMWRHHTSWYGQWKVGDSKLNLTIDTGSPFLVTNPGVYKPSSAGVNTTYTGKLTYIGEQPDSCGAYLSEYDQWNDAVDVGNITVKAQPVLDSRKVKSQAPGEITKLPPPFQGIMGFSAISAIQQPEPGIYPWFSNVCNQSLVDECRFGLAYGTDGNGQQILGSVDNSLFASALSYSSLYGHQYWAIPGSVHANGSKTSESTQKFVLGSGNPNVIGPMGQVEKIFKKLGLQISQLANSECPGGSLLFGYYPCDSPPNITFSVGQENFGLNPDAAYLKKDGNNCTSNLIGIDYQLFAGRPEPNLWNLGQAWMQGKYLDFDYTGKRVGVALLKDPAGPK